MLRATDVYIVAALTPTIQAADQPASHRLAIAKYIAPESDRVAPWRINDREAE